MFTLNTARLLRSLRLTQGERRWAISLRVHAILIHD